MNWLEYNPTQTALDFKSCQVKPEFHLEATTVAARLIAGESKYKDVAALTGVPWFIIGVLHQMECMGSFSRHLHNGDPLTARTVHVPKGRPVKDPINGFLPYTWQESACDALENYPPKPNVFDSGHTLTYLEAYNGFGYRKFGPSPYIWSGTSHYIAGKFSVDGVYDPTLISRQVGCASILRTLVDWKTIQL